MKIPFRSDTEAHKSALFNRVRQSGLEREERVKKNESKLNGEHTT